MSFKLKTSPRYDPREPIVLSSEGQLITDRFGMSSARASWWYHGPRPERVVAMFSRHPRWAFLELDKRTISQNEDSSWSIHGDYFGVDGTPEPIYSLDAATGQEPIETHPNFHTFAGSAPSGGVGVNGAVFDTDGLFVSFKQLVASGSVTNAKWVGMKAYLNASAVWREIRVTRTRPTVEEYLQLGRIDTPPGDPETPSGRNWLFGAMAYEQKGRTYTRRREWLLSGPGGWNDVVYAPSP